MSEALAGQLSLLFFAVLSLFVVSFSARGVGRSGEQKKLIEWAGTQEPVVRDAIVDWLTARRTFGDL